MNKELMDATSGARFLRRAEIMGDKDFFSRFCVSSVIINSWRIVLMW